ncbi:unnamed protein product [Closterium sp. NIES-65]|nr:unnamed protein product [Closterium sp. NIES-65]
MAHMQSTLSARDLTFAVLCSALWVATLPRIADSVPLSYVLSQIRDTSNTDVKPAGMTAGVVEFAAGYDKVDDISGSSLLFPINEGWTSALTGYKAKNPSATTSSDPVLEALNTVVSSSGSVSALNCMSANGKNALSRLAKFMAIRGTISTTDMESGSYKNGRFSFDTEVNQPIYLYANVTGALRYASIGGLDHVFTGTDRGAVEPTTYKKNGLMAGSDDGTPRAAADVLVAAILTTSRVKGAIKTTDSDMTAMFVTDVAFPANMGSLTSSDPVSPYGKGVLWGVDATAMPLSRLLLLRQLFPALMLRQVVRGGVDDA